MIKVTISYYTRGLYFGTNDQTVAWSVLMHGDPLCAETTEGQAREVAEKAFARARSPKTLVEWNGDTRTETTLKTVPGENR